MYSRYLEGLAPSSKVWTSSLNEEMRFMSTLVKLSIVCLSIVHLYAAVNGEGALRVLPSIDDGDGDFLFVNKEVHTLDDKGMYEYAAEGT